MIRTIIGGDKIECARPGCEIMFVKKVHNQKYHNKECCQLVTNERLLSKYYEKKKLIVDNRRCKTKSCQAILSKYNRGDYCGSCDMAIQWEILNKH